MVLLCAFSCGDFGVSYIINKIKLKTMEKMNYIAPEVEIIEVAIEQGFAQSNGNGGTYDGFGSENRLW